MTLVFVCDVIPTVTKKGAGCVVLCWESSAIVCSCFQVLSRFALIWLTGHKNNFIRVNCMWVRVTVKVVNLSECLSKCYL